MTIEQTVFVGEDSRPLRLGSLKGKVVVIDFWGKWCGPCMAEMSSLRDMQQSLRSYADRIVYVFVSIKTDRFPEDSAWLKQSGISGNNYRWEGRTMEQSHAFFSQH